MLRFARHREQISRETRAKRFSYFSRSPKCKGWPQTPSLALLLLLRRLAAHTFDRLGLAGDSDIGARDLSALALADDAAVGPRCASGRLRLDWRIVRRHGRLRWRLRHDIGGRQRLVRRAIGRRRRLGRM